MTQTHTSPLCWTRIHRTDGGHTIWQERDSRRYALSDLSGATPDTTDDGTLWIVSGQLIARGLHGWHVRLETDDGETATTITSDETASALQALGVVELAPGCRPADPVRVTTARNLPPAEPVPCDCCGERDADAHFAGMAFCLQCAAECYAENATYRYGRELAAPETVRRVAALGDSLAAVGCPSNAVIAYVTAARLCCREGGAA